MDIKSLIKESVKKSVNNFILSECINEDRTVMDDGTVEIDNFQNCADMMEYTHPGDTVYFVQIIKRDKDNPGVKSQFNACQYLKEFYFKSKNEFLAAENEIKTLCKSLSARAYIYMNARSKAVIDRYTKVEMDKIRRHRSLRQQYGGHEMAIAAGRSLDIPERPICFLDIDTDDFNIIKKVQQMVRDAGITPLFAYRSMNNGLHIILPNKEDAKKIDLSQINGKGWDATNRMKMNAKVSLEIDKPTLLYAALKPQGYDIQNKRLERLKRQQQQTNNYRGKK